MNAKTSQQELFFPLSVTKSKLYEMFRCRYMSIFDHFSDDQIEEGIRELQNDVLKDLKDDDLINVQRSMLVTRAEKVASPSLLIYQFLEFQDTYVSYFCAVICS